MILASNLILNKETLLKEIIVNGLKRLTGITAALAGLIAYFHFSEAASTTVEILNVSYDPTRELYQDYNQAFAEYWKAKTGQTVIVRQSHGGSGKQARAVIDGLEADVVTLALAYDIDAIHQKAGLIPAGWQSRLPNNSSPYTSTIVFLVRKGNPKGITDWNDLIKPGISVITPNPKTSGGARWNLLAAWGYVMKRELGSFTKINDLSAAAEVKQAEEKAMQYLSQLLKHVPVLDSGARGSTNTFVQRGIGDVLLAWENEAFLAVNELGPEQFDIVVPSISILAEPPVTVIDKTVKKHGTADVANEYLMYLYSPTGQRLSAKHYYRPVKPELADPEDMKRFPAIELFTIDEAFGGWQKAQKRFFDDNGLFDQIYVVQK